MSRTRSNRFVSLLPPTSQANPGYMQLWLRGVLPCLIDGEPACRGCAGVRLNVDRRSCGAEDGLYNAGRCWSCVVSAVFGQQIEKVVELIWDDVTVTDALVSVHLGGTEIAIPETPRRTSWAHPGRQSRQRSDGRSSRQQLGVPRLLPRHHLAPRHRIGCNLRSLRRRPGYLRSRGGRAVLAVCSRPSGAISAISRCLLWRLLAATRRPPLTPAPYASVPSLLQSSSATSPPESWAYGLRPTSSADAKRCR
ncbi:MAG: hypothetical protein QOG10_4671 [Kribbellaceae bacterium]|nr:hypothetical protein [Kribbellaceae bacterium]